MWSFRANWRKRALRYEFKQGISKIQVQVCILLKGRMKKLGVDGRYALKKKNDRNCQSNGMQERNIGMGSADCKC